MSINTLQLVFRTAAAPYRYPARRVDDILHLGVSGAAVKGEFVRRRQWKSECSRSCCWSCRAPWCGGSSCDDALRQVPVFCRQPGAGCAG